MTEKQPTFKEIAPQIANEIRRITSPDAKVRATAARIVGILLKEAGADSEMLAHAILVGSGNTADLIIDVAKAAAMRAAHDAADAMIDAVQTEVKQVLEEAIWKLDLDRRLKA